MTGLSPFLAWGIAFHLQRRRNAHSVVQLISHPDDASFPSDHLTFAFAVVAALYPVLGRTLWLWCLLGVLIGLARVFVGVHYPSDVLGGAILGAVIGGLTLGLTPWLARWEMPVLTRLARWRLA